MKKTTDLSQLRKRVYGESCEFVYGDKGRVLGKVKATTRTTTTWGRKHELLGPKPLGKKLRPGGQLEKSTLQGPKAKIAFQDPRGAEPSNGETASEGTMMTCQNLHKGEMAQASRTKL